jgi:small subunit ribosomal protein S14
MAKVSALNKNDKRIKLSDKMFKKRQNLKKIIMDKKTSIRGKI